MDLSLDEPLRHELAPHYRALRAIATRKQLHASDLWRRIGPEVNRVLDGVERAERPATATGNGVRAVAWNIQRGARLDDLRRALAAPPLAGADLILLAEVDSGLGRSGNRNVARELADALGMSYAFGVSYLTLEDDFGENPDGAENTLALAGTAILSRLPFTRVENVDLPELRDKFSSSEKRLGKKRALLAEVALPDGPLAVAACHLDSNASPAQRAQQLAAVLDRIDHTKIPRALVGGDFNTTSYNLSGFLPMVRDLLHKLFVTGFRGTIDQYMTPERRYERPIFEALASRGFSVEGFNDRAHGTICYDLADPYAVEKVRSAVGRFLTWLLQRLLRPWNGRVPARLDWFAARNLRALSAGVAAPLGSDGRPVSDHSPILVEVAPAILPR
jgi:endonuclease/exonuclease/phosphatase family metal-dependent hydrolase